MQNTPSPLPLLSALLLLFTALSSAELRVELIELPPDPADWEVEPATPAPARLSTLSERFAGTGLGRRFVRVSPESAFSPSAEVLLYTDPLLLSRTSPAGTNLVVDLSKQRVYLMVGRRMAMETEISVHSAGQTVPAGFFLMGDRIKDGPVSEGMAACAPYWMQLGCSKFGIHGGNFYGNSSTAGCLRVPLPAAEIIFEKTQEGTPVAVFDTWARDSYTPPGMDGAGEPLPAGLADSAAAPVASAPVATPVEPPSSVATQVEPLPSPASISPPSALRAVSGQQGLSSPSMLASPPVSIAPPGSLARGPSAISTSQLSTGLSPEPSMPPVKAASAELKPAKPRTQEVNAPEIARFRDLFRTPATPPVRSPLFPSDKRLKLLDLNAEHSPKRGVPGNETAGAGRRD